ALEAVRAALPNVHLYPDGGSFYLRKKLAAQHGLAEDEILVGHGSNELLDLLVRTFCGPGGEVVAPAQTFLCYKLSTLAHGAPFRETARGPHFAYRLDALADSAGP